MPKNRKEVLIRALEDAKARKREFGKRKAARARAERDELDRYDATAARAARERFVGGGAAPAPRGGDYRCRACRAVLFGGGALRAAEAEAHARCATLYLEAPPAWDAAAVAAAEALAAGGAPASSWGRLTCPCGARLGAFLLFGTRCACGGFVPGPAFCVTKARVDEPVPGLAAAAGAGRGGAVGAGV